MAETLQEQVARLKAERAKKARQAAAEQPGTPAPKAEAKPAPAKAAPRPAQKPAAPKPAAAPRPAPAPVPDGPRADQDPRFQRARALVPPKPQGSAAEQAMDAISAGMAQEGRLIQEGVREVADFAKTAVPVADRLVEGTAYELAEQAFSDPRRVGAFAVDGSTVGAAARQAARKLADEARDDVTAALQKSAKEREAAAQAAAKKAPRPGQDLAAARQLADTIRADAAQWGSSPAKRYVERRQAQLLARWGVDKVTDGERVRELEQEALDTARAELVRLNTEGYAEFLPSDALAGEEGPSNVERVAPVVERLAGPLAPAGAALGAAATVADSKVAQALKPQRTILESGKVARGESLPGWVINTVLGAPDYAATTAIDALVKEQAPTLDALAKNIDARRDPVAYQIENDPALQADIASGDAARVRAAILKLGPTAALMLATPDAATLTGGVAKLPGMVADTTRILARADAIADAVRAAEKGKRTTAALDALKTAAREVEAAKAGAAEAKRVDTAVGAGRMLDRALEKFDGDAERAIDQLDEWGENAAAMRIRDDIAARLSADTDIATFLEVTASTDRPLSRATVDQPGVPELWSQLDEAGQVAATRGKEKFTAAYEEAAKAAVEDFRAQDRGEGLAAVTRRDLAPVPEVAEAELDDLLGSRVLRPAQAQRIANAKTPEELVKALSRLPPEVQDRIAKRLGAVDYEDLKRRAKIDPNKNADATAKLQTRLTDEAVALQREMDTLAALRAGPEEIKQFAAAKKALTAAEKAAKAADKEAEAFAARTHPALKALADASVMARKVLDEDPPFQPSRQLQRDLQNVERAQDVLDAQNVSEATRARKQAEIDRRRRQYAQEMEVEQNQHAERLAAGREKREAALAEVRAARDFALAEEARITKAQQEARAALAAAQSAYAGTPAPKRPVARLSPTGRAVFDYLGEPIYRRGYAARPPMKYAKGVESHLLFRAIDVDFGAAKKYLTGPAAADFAKQGARIPHVGRPLPALPDGMTKGQFARLRVKDPTTGKWVAYRSDLVDDAGFPIQRGWEREVTWSPDGEACWKWADEVAEARPTLPRARSNNEFFRSLTAWADPFAKPDEVDLIRVKDTVFVNDADAAKRAGPLAQPLPDGVKAPDGASRIGPAVTDGLPAQVVGFRTAADGKPVAIVQPMEFSGARLQPKGNPIEVAPDALVYIERGRDGSRLKTDAEWKQIRADEDAMPGARTARYADKDRFVQIAPPERPTETDFNYNPDKAGVRRFFSDEVREAIRQEMGTDGLAPRQPAAGFRGEEQLKAAEDAVAKRQALLAELRTQLDELLREPAQRASLERALGAATPEYTDLARRMQQRAGAPPDQVLLEARGGLLDETGLVAELADAQRTIERATRQGLAGRMKTFGERIYDLFHPAREAEQRSFKPVAKDITRAFEGRTRLMNEELARAFQEIDRTSDVPNPRAWAIAHEYLDAFRESLRTGGAQPETVAAVTEAYIRNADNLSADQVRTLARVLAEWARDDLPLDALRDRLREVSDSFDYDLRLPQEGDAHLAYALSVEGAWRQALTDAKAQGVAMSPEAAAAMNTYMDAITGTTKQGGRAQASRGRALLARLLVPEDYRPPIKNLSNLTGSDVSRAMQTPMVPGTEERGLRAPARAGDAEAMRREAAVAEVEKVLDETARVMDGAVAPREVLYVPRAMRDALTKQLDAVIATARIGRDSGTGLLATEFWKQAVVLGVITSKPNQFAMDFFGDIAAANAAAGPRVAARVAARSLLAQFAGTRGAAQATRFVDWLRGQPPGSTARTLIAATSFTPDIDAIFRRDPNVRIGGLSAKELHDLWRRDGVFESFSSGQFSRSVATMAAKIHGDTAFGKALGAYETNIAALQDMANLAATRRRLAIAYTLMESGMDAKTAGRKAVEIAGDFSGELHPLEQKIIGWIFPFYSYRKFNARRTLKVLTSPFWFTRALEAQEGAAVALSWWMDDSDEFGFHTEGMETEPDPIEMHRIREEVANELGFDIASQENEEEALLRAKEQGIPTARARYDRLIARLRGMPYDQAKKTMQEDPDAIALVAYYAPDPGREMLPGWARDRYAVWLQEERRQATDSWWRANVGEYERKGDTQRFVLFPSDPHVTGLAEVLAVAAIGATVADAIENPGRPGSLGGGALFDGFFRNPHVQVLAGVGTRAGVSDYTTPMQIPDSVGPLLLRMGLAEVQTQQDRGQDVLVGQEGKTGNKYVIPPDVLNMLYLVPVLSVGVLGLTEGAAIIDGVQGKPRDPGPVDTTDRAMAAADVFLGQRTYQSTPSADAYFTKKAIDKRVGDLADAMPSAKPAAVGDDTMLRRALSTQRASPASRQEQRAAVAGIAAGRKPRVTDYIPLRAWLLEQGEPEANVLALSDSAVERRVREVLAGKEATQ